MAAAELTAFALGVSNALVLLDEVATADVGEAAEDVYGA
jgi:hypothetical protein